MSAFWSHVESLEDAGVVVLAPDEARHASARRLRVGDALVLFDGRGGVASARLESVAKRETVARIESLRREPRPATGLVLATAIPKGDRLSTLLQMLTQLGVETWQPLVLDESVTRKLDPSAPRLRRILVESAKVARRPWLLEVSKPCSLAEAIDQAGDTHAVFFGDREGAGRGLTPGPVLVAIGPEAGFSDAERRTLADARARPVRFARDNLRIETAAVAAATAHALAESASAEAEEAGATR